MVLDKSNWKDRQRILQRKPRQIKPLGGKMTHKIYSKSILILSVIILVLTLTSGSVAVAQNEGEVKDQQAEVQQTQNEIDVAVPGGPGFISVPATVFQPFLPTVQWGFSAYKLYNPSETIAGKYIAAIDPPNGATINKVVLFYDDSDPSGDISFDLIRASLSALEWGSMGSVVSSGTPGVSYGEDTSILFNVINLQEYTYFLVVTIPPKVSTASIKLYGVRIDYGYSTYAPLINK